jgi:hypothetical protein
VPSGLSNVIAVAGGTAHSLALSADGTVVAWGSYVQNDVPNGLTNVIAIADGTDHCLAIVAPPHRLLLANPRWQNGAFTVSVPTLTGKTYALQYKSGLSAGAWTQLPAEPGTGSMLTLTDPSASSTQRFFRVSEQ